MPLDLSSPLYSDNWTAAQIDDAKRLKGPIWIVGASGFVGAKLFFNLLKIRDDVVAVSRNPQANWRLSAVNTRNLKTLDIAGNPEVLKREILLNKPRTVFNMAAYGAYARQTDRQLIHQTNYMGVLTLISALLESGCDAFVQAGSSSEYGLNCTTPREDGTLVPNSDYSVSKIGASYLVNYFGKFDQFPAVNLRLYSIYGPWEDRGRLIPNLVLNGLEKKYPPLVSPEISRDFVYVDDCAYAFVKAALTVCQTDPGISVNIASGVKTTLRDATDHARQVFGIAAPAEFGSMPNRKWDLKDWVGDPTLAANKMNWQATTSFADGLRLTGDWETQAKDRFLAQLPTAKSRKVSMVVACYQDNQAIPVLHRRITDVFAQLPIDYEIIFVNDGSPANDEAVIHEIAKTDFHVMGVTHSRNFGSQSAFLSGMELASGDAVILMDGDGQDPPELIPQLIEKWVQGNDIVYGERVKRDTNWPMQILYKVFYRIFRRMAEIPIPVDAGDFSLIDQKAVHHLIRFPEKDVFLRGLRAWIGFKQASVPYTRPERLFGVSTNPFLKNIWWAKKAIFSFSLKPLHYMQAIGILGFFATILLSLGYLANYFLNPPPAGARGITTIILLVLGIGSFQVIFISLLGDYVGKILEEVKNRPRFIRKQIFYYGKRYDNDADMTQLMQEIEGARQ